jgi:hypothetical protein
MMPDWARHSEYMWGVVSVFGGVLGLVLGLAWIGRGLVGLLYRCGFLYQDPSP